MMADFNSKMSESTEDESRAMVYGPKALNLYTGGQKISDSRHEVLK